MAGRRSKTKRPPKSSGKRSRPAKAVANLVGARYTRLIEEHLQALHNHPSHGNRQLFLDQIVVAHLLAFFNPTIKGLRGMEDIFEHRRNRQRYSTPRLPKSTVSDAQRVFDPSLLLPLIASLVERAQIQPHDTRLETLTVKPLTDEDVAAGVVADHRVTLGARPQRFDLPLMRVVEVEFMARDGELKRMHLLTNLLEVPAWMIALIYQHRWQVELFFRWLKCSADFRHFFSESESGMTLQVYVMMIALLLIAVETGARPSRYDYTIMAAVCSGLMPLKGSLEIAERRRRERRRAAERQRQKNKR